MPNAMSEYDPCEDMSDAELEELSQRIQSGEKIVRPGQWRVNLAESSDMRAELITSRTINSGRALLVDDEYQTDLRLAVRILLLKRLGEPPRPTNQEAVAWILQELCRGESQYLTNDERHRYLETVVPVIREQIAQRAQQSLQIQTGSKPLSRPIDSSVDGSSPDTDRLSFHTAEYYSEWVLRQLAALDEYETVAPEESLIFQYAEFAVLEEHDLSSCFQQPVEFIRHSIVRVRHYLKTHAIQV